MIKLNSGGKRIFLVTFVINLILLFLYNSFLNLNVLMEKKLAQQSTITTNEFKTSFSIFINKSSNTSISNFVTSNLRESLSASVSDACVYSIQNKSKID